MASISLNNFAATPVSYSVLSTEGNVGIWADVSQGTTGGFRTVSEQVKRPQDATKGVTRVLFRIARPFVNTTTGQVDYILRANTEVLIPVQATLAERQELYAMLKNFMAHANAQAAIKDLEGVY
jgi:hypothetical protein